MFGARKTLLAILFVSVCTSLSPYALASAAAVYVTQNGAGNKNGTSLENAFPLSALSNGSTCGAGSSQIGAGTTVFISVTTTGTSAATFPAGATMFTLPSSCSGGSGNPVMLQFQAGDVWQAPYFNANGAIILDGDSNIVVDGGGTATYGANGVLFQDTLNGSSGGACPGGACQYQQDSRMFSTTPCNGCEFRNMVVANFYVHTSSSDTAVDANSVQVADPQGSNWSFHDSTIHDCGWCFNQNYTNDDNVQFYNLDLYNFAHGIACAGANYTVQHEFIYNNHFHDPGNWATGSSDAYHNNGVHCYNLSISGSGNTGGIQNLYLYNNLFDGNTGNCCMTSWVYLEANNNGCGSGYWTNSTGTAYAWNNIFINNQDLPNAQLDICAGSSHVVYNNIFLISNQNNGNCLGLYGAGSSSATFVNNAFSGCQTAMYINGILSLSANNNGYANIAVGGNNIFQWAGVASTNSFSAWKSACACDSASSSNLTGTLGTTTTGVPQAGSMLLQLGANLMGSAVGDLLTLASYTSAGNTGVTPGLRPQTGLWPAGAYGLGGDAPNPPTGLAASVQ